ncbi:MAG: class I SAM-dependent methyltransferase [Anaerolineae bacterium]|nr:class I SAM-dependent methyltransferase [Anaerolineae bacterium]
MKSDSQSMASTMQNRPGADDILHRELIWHDEESFRRKPLNAIIYRDPAFQAVKESGYKFLQPQFDEWILDFGGGEGKESLEFLKMNLRVINVDLSTTQLLRARALVTANNPNANIFYVQADAENMPFTSGAFRIIYGKAILHHLDMDSAAAEINRLLPAEGKASFAEPMTHHPLIKLGRWLTPRLRTVDEHPFTLEATKAFVRHFAEDHSSAHFLLAPAAYVLRLMPGAEQIFRKIHRWLQKVDKTLFKKVPGLQKWAWYRVVNIKKSYDVSNPDGATSI